MKIVQLVRCAFGRHLRDRRLVWHDGSDFYSVCTGCGAPMVRTIHGWELGPAPRRPL
jgi:hypothetical protein